MISHLLSAKDLDRDDAVLVLDTAGEMARLTDRSVKETPRATGQDRGQSSSRTPPGPGSRSRRQQSACPPT